MASLQLPARYRLPMDRAAYANCLANIGSFQYRIASEASFQRFAGITEPREQPRTRDYHRGSAKLYESGTKILWCLKDRVQAPSMKERSEFVVKCYKLKGIAEDTLRAEKQQSGGFSRPYCCLFKLEPPPFSLVVLRAKGTLRRKSGRRPCGRASRTPRPLFQAAYGVRGHNPEACAREST